MRSLLLTVGLCLTLLSLTSGYPTGAPSGACISMFPNHGVNPQTMPSPYQITLSKTNFTSGDEITVTLASSSGEQFKGYLCQGRYLDASMNQEIAVGSFDAPAGAKQECSGAMGNGVTHSSNSLKTSVTLKWTAPNPSSAHVRIYCTFVKETATIWVQEPSANLIDGAGGPLPTTPPPPSPAAPIAISVNDCGSGKGCYRVPDGCDEASCRYLVTWKESSQDSDYFTFEMSSINTEYIALGFSLDKHMGDDSVVVCAYSNITGTVVIQNYYNEGKGSGRVSSTGLTRGSGYLGGSRISCRFDRKKMIDADQIFNLDKMYYLLVAQGFAAPTGAIKKHQVMTDGQFPLVSPAMVDFSGSGSKPSLTGRATYPLMKVHGCLMTLAWVLTASVGIILARYYKPMWVKSRACGERVWFQIHRSCMITTLALTIIAFIIIFVEVGGYSLWRGYSWWDAHPILGIIVTVLCILNPIISIFRCHPGDPDRPIFNWIHWLFGAVAHFLATPTIFLGMGFPKVFVPWWATWIMVAWVIFHVVCELILEIHQCCMNRRNKEKREEIEMEKKGDPRMA
ncbi:unnamed protein product, partial [Owenia fusiformis]